MNTVEHLLADLNDEQRAAVTHEGGPLLIVAGAGTGKTTVITRRIAWLSMTGRCRPEEVLAMTFTNKAAAEMEERVDRVIPYGYVDLWISTFHAFCEKIVRRHALEIGLPMDFKLVNQTTAWMLVRKNLHRFDLNIYRPLGSPTKFIHEMIKHFSRCKDEEIAPQEYLDYAQKNNDQKIVELAHAFQTYEQILLENSALDFGGLITAACRLFRERPEIRERYRKQFRYILVDEFQDTNFAQYELIKLLSAPEYNITVVGDDDQSVYKFRGASLANILEFKKEYPHSKEVVLVHNYRSAQTILDTAYRFIQHNNPRRLECQLETLDKKLRAALPKEGSVAHIHCETVDEEVATVLRLIEERMAKDTECSWGEFAILIRSNQFAKPFCSAFERAGVPYQFISQKGLYAKSIILDAIAYFTVVDNVYENPSLYRVLAFPFWNLSPLEVMELTHTATKKGISLWEALSESSLPQASVVRVCIEKHTLAARTATPTEMFLLFLHDTDVLERLKNGETQEQRESLSYLNQFYRVIKDRQNEDPSLRLREFLLSLEYEREAGDEGSLASDIDLGPDTVKIMTVHASKGLEFSTVFVVHMADKKFPTIERDDALPLPLELVKEDIPLEGDVHMEEERRLLYVAITRAKKDVFFLSAGNYGGAQVRKPSRFLAEAGCELPQKSLEMKEKKGEKTFSLRYPVAQNPVFVKESYPLPTRFSFTQLSAFQKCPLQYKFAFVVKIPIFGKPQLSFGKSMHATLQRFVQEAISRTAGKEIVAWPSLTELSEIFDQCWSGEWYRSKKEQEEYRQKGSAMLSKFHERIVRECASRPYMVEKDFTIKIPTASGPVTVKGRIDRVDTTPQGGVEIIDYKTGTPKLSTELRGDDKEQLVLYHIAAEEALGKRVEKLTYLYLKDTTSVSFLAGEKEKQKLKEKIGDVIDEIKKSSFLPTPGWHCRSCDFRDICEFRQV